MVAVTAYDTYGMKEAAEEASCDAYLAKPIDQREFDRTLRRLLPSWFWQTTTNDFRARGSS